MAIYRGQDIKINIQAVHDPRCCIDHANINQCAEPVLRNKIPEIFPVHHHGFGLVIFRECEGKADLLLRAPFEFEGLQRAVAFLDEVDFLPCLERQNITIQEYDP